MTDHIKKKVIQTAIEAAQRAGRAITELYPGERSLTIKGFRDVVTDTDTTAEGIILDLIRARFPDHNIISEEAGDSKVISDYTWVVDPLDGTTNYTHCHPVFATSIGVLKEGEPFIGVIHDPLRDQTFTAERGCGARLNDELIHVSKVVSLEKAMVGFDWGHSNKVRKRILNYLNSVVSRCGTLRVLGSAALAMAYVAAGWLDAYFNIGLKAWDSAAGMLIITEAGGKCSTLGGKPYYMESGNCLASNKLIHDETLIIMHGFDTPL